MRNVLDITDLSVEELNGLIAVAEDISVTLKLHGNKLKLKTESETVEYTVDNHPANITIVE